MPSHSQWIFLFFNPNVFPKVYLDTKKAAFSVNTKITVFLCWFGTRWLFVTFEESTDRFVRISSDIELVLYVSKFIFSSNIVCCYWLEHFLVSNNIAIIKVIEE